MSTVVTWNGVSYTVPATGEENWGGSTKVDGLLVSLVNNGFQKAGGTFTLSADADFGVTAGLKSIYYKSRGTVGTSGIFRLANAEIISWRNAANSANKELTVNSSDQLTYAGVVIASSAGVVPVASGGTNITSYTTGDVIYASSSSVLAKLGIGSAGQSLITSGGLPAWGVALLAGGGTGLSSYTAGDMLYYAAGTLLSKLAIGTANYVNVSTGTAPSWALVVNANIDAAAAIARTKIANGTASHVVINDGSGTFSSEATLAVTRGGLALASYTTGDIVYASGATAISKLGIGSTGQALKVVGGIPAWGTLAEVGGGTNQTTYTTGDILYASAANTLSKLAAGASGTFLKSNGVAAPSWDSVAQTFAVASKATADSPYTVLTTDNLIVCNAAAGVMTLNLYAASGNAGKQIIVKKTDSSANSVTIDGNASETIDGATTYVVTIQYESVHLVCDGSNWHLI